MIDLLPSEEQRAIADGVAAFLKNELPISRFRGSGLAGADDRWAELTNLGAFAISIPEANGGLGLSLAEDALVFREFGRYLLSPAVLATRMAAAVAIRAGETRLCEELITGQARAGLAIDLNTAERQCHVIDLRPGDYCVRVTAQAVQIFDHDAIMEPTPVKGLDETVSIAHARILGTPRLESRDAVQVQGAYVLCAAMLSGLLEATRDMAADYARQRVQFGRPIGVFQGVKHRCADIGLAAEAAWSQTVYAALMIEAAAVDAPFHALNAKMLAGEGAVTSAQANIQIHGGMGFTDEVDAHLLLKRAHLLHQAMTDPRRMHRELLAMPLQI